MNQNMLRIFLFITLSIGSVHLANAALVTRLSGQAVYDTDLNVTWIADANLAESNTFGVDGIATSGGMSWSSGKPLEWLSAMNNARYLGFDDWRLPLTAHPDSTCSNVSTISVGTGCKNSELGHLFYNELGGVAGQPIALDLGQGVDVGPFVNMTVAQYWSATETPAGFQYTFSFASGGQVNQNVGSVNFALALRNGDVGVVPIPAAAWLFGSALLGLGIVKRKRA